MFGMRLEASVGVWLIAAWATTASAAEPAMPFEKTVAELKAVFPSTRPPFINEAADAAEERFTASMHLAVQAENFAEMQKQFDAAFNDQEFTAVGRSKYVALFDAVAYPDAIHLQEPKERVAFCTRWLQAFPKSTAAAALRMDAQLSYAWQARGGGYAYTITEEGGRRFSERLQAVEPWIEEAKKLPVDDPLLFAAMIDYAKATSGGHKFVDDLVQRSAASPLRTLRPYLAAAEYYLPRWHGEPGELESYALRVYELTKAKSGAAVYAEIVIRTSSYHSDKLFNDFSFSYPLVEQGLIDSQQETPGRALPAVQLCWITCYAEQREKAKVMFEYLGADANKFIRDDFYQQYYAWSKRDPLKLGKSIFELKGWTGPLLWEPDGKAVICATDDGLHRIEPAVGTVDLSFPMPDLESFARSRDGRYLATVTDNGRAALFDLQDKQAKQLHFSREDIGFVSVHITPDDRIVARSRDGKLFSWTISGDGQEQSWMLSKAYPWHNEALTPDGEFLLARPERGDGLALWDTRTGMVKQTWPAPPPKIKPTPLPNVYLPRCTAVSADGKQAVLGLVRRLQVWNIGEAKPAAEAEFGDGAVAHALFTADGKRLLTAMWRFRPATVGGKATLVQAPSDVLLWNLADMQIVQKFEGHESPVTFLALSPDGKRFASASYDRTVRIWNLPE